LRWAGRASRRAPGEGPKVPSPRHLCAGRVKGDQCCRCARRRELGGAVRSASAGRLSGALRRAAVRATRAPSVHNTQPWRIVLDENSLELHADWDRRLQVLDPRGRQLLLSCGCALFNAQVALAGAGLGSLLTRFPDPGRPTLLARIVLDESVRPDQSLAVLDRAIDIRRTNRRAFTADPVPAEVIAVLLEAARVEGALIHRIERAADRLATARLSQQAEAIERADPAYRAELLAWTSADLHRDDGVLSSTVPRVGAAAGCGIAMRDFDTHASGQLPAHVQSPATVCLLLLGTAEDNPFAWLLAGQALERMLLEIAGRGYAASPFTQLIEVAETNEQLRAELTITMYPHVLLRVGRAPQSPATRRRRLVEVLAVAPEPTPAQAH
jgi:nitroreductase